MTIEETIKELQIQLARDVSKALESCEHTEYSWENIDTRIEDALTRKGWLRSTGRDNRGDFYVTLSDEGKQALDSFRQSDLYKSLKK